MSKIKLGVLLSGGGSNLQAIIDNIEGGRLSADIRIVVSNEPGAGGLDRAARHGLEHIVLNHRDYPSREKYDEALVELLGQKQVDLVVLAGFMRLITPVLIQAYSGRIMNIHPALLPSFPGTHVWGDQIEYGVKIAGCTVHFVDQGMDTGPIIIQAATPVLDGDDPDALAARILRQEHRIYSRAIQLFAEGRLKIEGRRVRVVPRDDSQDLHFLVNPPLEG